MKIFFLECFLSFVEHSEDVVFLKFWVVHPFNVGIGFTCVVLLALNALESVVTDGL
jgi:hypothetical protein